ncbi:MAG: sigma-54-dependent Fis family transcriptional regulator [Gammaproteobacteria bacterium]|nr:sigma-54-dependent Fis family transcriptional regulator [Gammaproteobacteria bacterium]
MSPAGRDDALLRLIEDAGAPVADRVYFRSLARHLAQAVGARYALVAAADGRRLRLVVRWAHERFLDELELHASADPFAGLMTTAGPATGIAPSMLFASRASSANSAHLHFIAVPLVDHAGHTLGFLAALDEAPIADDPELRSLLRIFAERAVAEFERRRVALAVASRTAHTRELAAILGDLHERGDPEPALDELARLDGENEMLRRVLDLESGSPCLLGESASMRAVDALITEFACTDEPVSISGETGTGKALAAAAIHARSPRAGRPFVKIDCALPAGGTSVAEILGGGPAATPGGTLFLDEIAELADGAQAGLLDFLRQRQAARATSAAAGPGVRLIAATNRDLAALVRGGRFSAELHARLGARRLDMPPLRERGADVLLLARHFLGRAARGLGRKLEGYTPASRSRMLGYAWPGNVRELENVVERAALLAHSPIVDLAAQLE